MCKVIMIPNASKVKSMNGLARKCADLLSDQRDGYGYAAVGKKGVFGSRTLYPSEYGKGTSYKLPYAEDTEDNSVPFGKPTKSMGGAMFHGRISTNQKTLVNTHPIERDGHYIIHNGVVTHHGPKYDANTTNDTEHVLFNFLSGGIETVSKNLTGYYAVGIIDKEYNMHIFKDSIAQLHVAYSNVLESPVFATTAELVTKVGKYIGENLKAAVVKDDTYIVFDKQGKLIHQTGFESRGYDDYSAKHARSSLGYDLVDNIMSVSFKDDMPTLDRSGSYETYEEFVWNNVSDEFLDEIQYLDDTYTIHMDSRQVGVHEFESMDIIDQVECVIIRPNGTKVEWKRNMVKYA